MAKINPRFLDYMHATFFENKEEEEARFLESLFKWVPKTIRVNTNKVSLDFFVKHMEKKGYQLKPTHIFNVFEIYKGEDFDDLEGRLGFSIEHLLGWFYIQEISAATSVAILTDQKTNPTPNIRILDMASSPGGKTTQLAEYFPLGSIVANEFTRSRIGKLLANIERIGCENIGVTQFNGSLFGYYTEMFDYVLLDAPCSGEGIGYKSRETLAYWNIKNIKTIAKLQQNLCESALITLKTGGEMVYSTCTLNKIENEGVLDAIKKKYGDAVEIISQKRFWPHEEIGGGFFVAKIKKLKKLPAKNDRTLGDPKPRFLPLNEKELRLCQNFFVDGGWENSDLYTFTKRYDDHIFMLPAHSSLLPLQDTFSFESMGKDIGKITPNEFVPNCFFGRDYPLEKLRTMTIESQLDLDKFLKGEERDATGITENWVNITYEDQILGCAKRDRANDKIKNPFPRTWLRK